MADPDGAPTWQPLSALPMLTAHIRDGITLARDQLALLAPARERPHVLDDATVARLRAAFEKTRDDIDALFAEQSRRWQAEAATPAQQAAVAEYVGLVAEERGLVEEVLAVAAELAAGTIEKVMAKSDLELGLEALTGLLRRPNP